MIPVEKFLSFQIEIASSADNYVLFLTCVSTIISGVYTGMKIMNTCRCRWQWRLEEIGIFLLKSSSTLWHDACVAAFKIQWIENKVFSALASQISMKETGSLLSALKLCSHECILCSELKALVELKIKKKILTFNPLKMLDFSTLQKHLSTPLCLGYTRGYLLTG